MVHPEVFISEIGFALRYSMKKEKEDREKTLKM